jgi:beta-fructofuranosidase
VEGSLDLDLIFLVLSFLPANLSSPSEWRLGLHFSEWIAQTIGRTLECIMKNGPASLCVVTLMFSACFPVAAQSALPELRDKTLVAWVSPANLTQHGGSVLTIDDQRSHFDGIIFGEIAARKWMAGSDYYARSKQDQASAADETSDPGTLVQIAIVYQNKQITVYRDGKEYSRHAVERPQSFGGDSAVVIGLRHLEAADRACFAGVVDDARIYNIALSAEQITLLKPKQLSDPKPVAWWNFENGKPEDAMGTFPAARLVGKAYIANGKLVLDGEESFMITPPSALVPKSTAAGNRYDSPIHFRPNVGALADTIPFFWKGHYHIFYLRAGIGKVPWEHIVSTDLMHWKQLPTALVSDGAPDGPDGMNMFTGSVMEHNGTFHIFYTGDNNRNTNGFEFICHATSPDLITWTKQRQQAFRDDGVTYKNSDFRDPYVFWNKADHAFWMIICARDARTGNPAQGVVRSTDLISWQQVFPLNFDPPLGQGTPECPDLFRIGETWHLIHSPSAGTTDMRYATDIRGPYHSPLTPTIDTPILYAAKRMFDGRRHILTGWIRDLDGERDDGGFRWGGDQCVPREVYAGARGQLLFRPVREAVAAFPVVVADSRRLPHSTALPSSLSAPDNYMLECRVQLSGNSEFTLSMREQAGPGSGYRLILRPAKSEVEIASRRFSYPRRVDLDCSKPVSLRAFVQGSIIECFIDDAYAFSCRAYEARSGQVSMISQDNQSKVLDWTIKVPDSAQAVSLKRN